ncbi:MAG TPA: Gfo/Idh/MocA family oxidoreductase [Fimbriimonadaceae bacterium]|nr:Gfo/Idh/MocA family oxidoreductase [Fimbriimonadaceae bacterium]
MDKLKWGILGTGAIAKKFAQGLERSQTGVLVAVGSRSIETARLFSETYRSTPFGSYEELLSYDQVDAVYISLPHHLHAEWTVKCAAAGKHILCEKPFTLDAPSAERALDAVAKANVFFMEAFMYRCHPQTQELARLVREGAIGRPLVVNAEFGFAAGKEWDNFRTVGELGGGGLMDVGTYCVSMSRLLAGEEPSRGEYTAMIGDKGYDEWGTGTLIFPGGMTAMFGTGIHAQLRNDVRIYGSEGSIHVPSPWFCGEPMTLVRGGNEERVRVGEGLDLYGHEADTVARHLSERQAPEMSWQDTLSNMRALDMLRRSAGLRFGDHDAAF